MISLRCKRCGAPLPARSLSWRCDKCFGPLIAEGMPPLTRSAIDQHRRSLWRYQKSLVHTGPVAISLGEGWTPLVEGDWNGRRVLWKCEFASISGSFKDRGVAVMINHLLSLGVNKFAEDSSGNAGAAVATYAAAAQSRCRIYVPAHASSGKITQIEATGAELIRIEGSRQAVAEAAMADDSGYWYASHNWDPAFLDGIKTIGYEIWEQLGFSVPDAIIAPTGSGSNLLGCFNAFDDLRKSQEVERLPLLFGVQSENCAPLARAFETGAPSFVKVETQPTIAEGIAVSHPVRSAELLDAVHQSGGGIFSVSEDQIAQAHDKMARRGLYVEPTTATAAALLDKLIDEAILKPGQRVVVILTGSGLKAGELISQLRKNRQRTS